MEEVIYVIGEGVKLTRKIADGKKFRVYTGLSGEDMVVVKVANTVDDNSKLKAETVNFCELRIFDHYINSFQRETLGVEPVNYKRLFANLKSSFLDEDGRMVNVFSFPDIEVDKLIPLLKIYKDMKIDARTSVWILGRLFKLYSMSELEAVMHKTDIKKYRLFSLGDYLIGPESHELVYYNYSGVVDSLSAVSFIKVISKTIDEWVIRTGDSLEGQYLSLLDDFKENGRETFDNAHEELYKLIRCIWGSKYHPFTYCMGSNSEFKSIGG